MRLLFAVLLIIASEQIPSTLQAVNEAPFSFLGKKNQKTFQSVLFAKEKQIFVFGFLV